MEAEDCDCSLQIRDTLSTAHHSTHEAIRAGAKGLLWERYPIIGREAGDLVRSNLRAG